MFYIIAQTALIVLFPLLALRSQRSSHFPTWLSPVVQCYAVGIILASFTNFPVNEEWAEYLVIASILPALPLLLFSTKIEESWRLTGRGLVSFLLCCLSGMIATGIAALLFSDQIAGTDKIAGMLTGLYTGGTVNLQALTIALDASQETFLLLQAADIVVGGIYLILLTSILPRYLARFFPAFQTQVVPSPQTNTNRPSYNGWIRPISASILVAILAITLVWLLTGGVEQQTLLILLLTSLSIGASFLPEVRSWTRSYALGEYFLLVFSVAVGMLADFGDMISSGKMVLGFSTIALSLAIIGHFLLARLFRIDRDTVMISSVAAFFGPVFVGQIVAVLRNKQLLAPGIALALFGFAIGNYLGILVAYLVRQLII